MKNQIKKAAVLMFAAGTVLSVGLLAGCAGSGKAGGAAGNESSIGNENGTSGSGNGAGGAAAKGRYMENEIAFPEETAQMTLVNCLPMESGGFEFYFGVHSEEGTKLYRYTYENEKWTQQDLPFQGIGSLAVKDVLKGEDGAYYIGGFDKTYTYHLYTADESGNAEQRYEELFRVPEGKDYGMIPDYLSVLSDGSLLVSTASEAYVYSKDGKQMFPLAQDFIGMEIRVPAYTAGQTYLTSLDGQIVNYDLKTGTQTAAYPLPEQLKKSIGNMVMFTDQDESIYAAGQGGLYHTGKNGTIWEQIIDGSLNSMGRQDIYLRGFYPGPDNDYYGVYFKSNGDGGIFYHYVYDETVDTVPPKTLTVYSLRDSATVRQAASMMQKNNPDVRIDLRIAVDNEEEEVTEDVIRALNTELLNGKGADVLILDGLPAESYRNKGILMDLSGTLAAAGKDLLPNLAGGFTAEDGGIYYLPARIKVPVVFGSQGAVEALTSLDAMASYEGAQPLLVPDIYENILRLTARTCYTELFDDDGLIKDGVLEKWLTSVKTAGEKSGAKVEFTPEESKRLSVNNYVRNDGFGRQSNFELAGGQSEVGADLLTSIDSAMLTVAACDMKNCEIQSIKNTYVPALMVGINASTEQKETAETFIKTLFGAEVQDEMLWDGFAVRTDSLDKWAAEEKDSVVSISMQGMDFSLEGEWPSREVRDEILELVRNTELPVMIDESVLGMIVSGSRNYLDGKEPVEGAVQAIENQIRLYTAEKE